MADGFREVHRLAHDLGKIPGRVVPQVRATVKKAGQNVKDGTIERLSTHPSWKHLGRSVGYDMFGLAVEVGYELKGQGKLGHVAEFGSKRKAPHPALIPAGLEEEPRFLDALAKIEGWEP